MSDRPQPPGPSRDDHDKDLDWLYRRDEGSRPRPEQVDQPTAVMPPVQDQYPPTRQFPPTPQQPGWSTPPRPRPMPAAGSSMPPPGPPPRPTGQAAQPPRAPRRRRRPRPARLLVVLLLAYLLFLVGTPIWMFSQGNRIDAMPTGERPGEQPGKVFLLVGSDSRENLSEEQKKKYGTGSTDGARTDTILLLVLPRTGKPALVSIPRDSYVPIPGKGKNKINAAYAWGGPQLLVETIEQVSGVRIDGYLQIGMVGFAETVDAVGGVNVCLDKPMKDRDSHADFPAGCQDFDGRDALAYVRMRKADPTGDLGRMKRQREIIGKVADKAASPLSLWPPRWWALNQVAGQMLVRDQDTSTLDLAAAARAFLQVSKGEGTQLVVPIANPNASTPAGSSMLWDRERALGMFTLIKQGSTQGIEEYAKP